MKIYLVNEGGWEQAFKDCREKDCPTIIHVAEREGETISKWKLYPSGKAIRL